MLEEASLDDLVVTKMKVILQRAEGTDYHNNAEMLRVGVSLSAGIAAVRDFFWFGLSAQ